MWVAAASRRAPRSTSPASSVGSSPIVRSRSRRLRCDGGRLSAISRGYPAARHRAGVRRSADHWPAVCSAATGCRATTGGMTNACCRSHHGARFAQSGRVACGFVRSVSGGDISAPVLEEKPDPAGFVQKHLGTPVYEDIALQVGLAMGPARYDWIAATWARNFERKTAPSLPPTSTFRSSRNRRVRGGADWRGHVPGSRCCSKGTQPSSPSRSPLRRSGRRRRAARSWRRRPRRSGYRQFPPRARRHRLQQGEPDRLVHA